MCGFIPHYLLCQTLTDARQLTSEGKFDEAFFAYSSLLDEDKENSVIFDEYLRVAMVSGHYEDAIYQIQERIRQGKNTKPDSYFKLAQAQYWNEDFDSAISSFKLFLSRARKKDPNRELARLRILQASTGKKLSMEESFYEVQQINLSELKFEVWNPAYSPEFPDIFYCQVEVSKDGNSHSSIYSVDRMSDNVQILTLDNPFPEDNFLIGFSEDGQLMRYRDQKSSQLRVEEKRKFKSSDYVPEGFEPLRGDCCLQNVGDRLYIFSEKTAQNGYEVMIVKKNLGQWSDPIPLIEIGSPFDEIEARLYPEKGILIFASNRVGSVGGLDLFYSTYSKQNNKWSEPKNLGIGINSVFDEKGLVFRSDMRHGMFASNREQQSWKLYEVFLDHPLVIERGDPFEIGNIKD